MSLKSRLLIYKSYSYLFPPTIVVCLLVVRGKHNNGFFYKIFVSGRHGHDRLLVGFITTYAISAYCPRRCQFESRSWRGVQHYVIKSFNDLRQVSGFLQVLRCHPPIKLTATI